MIMMMRMLMTVMLMRKMEEVMLSAAMMISVGCEVF